QLPDLRRGRDHARRGLRARRQPAVRRPRPPRASQARRRRPTRPADDPRPAEEEAVTATTAAEADTPGLAVPGNATRAFLLSIAAVFLGQALQINNGNGHEDAWPYLFATLLVLAVAALSPPWETVEASGDQLAVLVLGVGLALQFSQLVTSPPGYYARPIPGFRQFFATPAPAAGVAVAALGRRPALGPFHAPVLVLLFALAGWWMIRASYPPHIDVFVFQQEASRALVHGRNPYALTFPNIYGNMQF